MCNCEQSIFVEEYEKETFKAVGVFLLMLVTLLSMFFIESVNWSIFVAFIALLIFCVFCFSVKKVVDMKKTQEWINS